MLMAEPASVMSVLLLLLLPEDVIVNTRVLSVSKMTSLFVCTIIEDVAVLAEISTRSVPIVCGVSISLATSSKTAARMVVGSVPLGSNIKSVTASNLVTLDDGKIARFSAMEEIAPLMVVAKVPMASGTVCVSAIDVNCDEVSVMVVPVLLPVPTKTISSVVDDGVPTQDKGVENVKVVTQPVPALLLDSLCTVQPLLCSTSFDCSTPLDKLVSVCVTVA